MSGGPKPSRGARVFRGAPEEASSSGSVHALLLGSEDLDPSGCVAAARVRPVPRHNCVAQGPVSSEKCPVRTAPFSEKRIPGALLCSSPEHRTFWGRIFFPRAGARALKGSARWQRAQLWVACLPMVRGPRHGGRGRHPWARLATRSGRPPSEPRRGHPPEPGHAVYVTLQKKVDKKAMVTPESVIRQPLIVTVLWLTI